jgi:hypothetical protein
MAIGVRVVDATEIAPAILDQFLRTFFPSEKCDFLSRYGHWHHHGNQNRFLLLKDGELAGYCATIPTRIHLDNRVVPAVWWIDLFIQDRFRGQKLQGHFDNKVREIADTLLGIPNPGAARIHKKHGWGVRGEYHVMLLPLYPPGIPALQHMYAWKGKVAKVAARLSMPVTWLYKQRVMRRDVASAWKVPHPDPELLARIFSSGACGWVTTNRDSAFFRWRYLDSPYLAEYAFFVAGPSQQDLTVAAITRTLQRGSSVVTRILDIFGDLDERLYLSSLLTLIIQNSISQGAVQITVAATNQQLLSVLKRKGFFPVAPFRFCWISHDPAIMRAIQDTQSHWCLADSDSDMDV